MHPKTIFPFKYMCQTFEFDHVSINPRNKKIHLVSSDQG